MRVNKYMIKKNIQKLICFVVLLFIWLFPSLDNFFFSEDLLSLGAFILCMAAVRLINKKIIAVLLSAVVTLAISIYSEKYFYYAVVPLAIYISMEFALAEATDKKYKDKGFFLLFITGIWIILCIQAVLIFISGKSLPHTFGIIRIIRYAVLFIFILAGAFFYGKSKLNAKEPQLLKELKKIPATAVASIFITLIYFLQHNSIASESEIIVALSYWFVFLSFVLLEPHGLVRFFSVKKDKSNKK